MNIVRNIINTIATFNKFRWHNGLAIIAAMAMLSAKTWFCVRESMKFSPYNKVSPFNKQTLTVTFVLCAPIN